MRRLVWRRRRWKAKQARPRLGRPSTRTTRLSEEGTRVLYSLPQAETDSLLPLHLQPQPRELVRVMVGRLEMQIDQAEEQLSPLRQFILPAGGEAACRLHLARTVCRRAERRIVAFAMDRPVPHVIITYLNRLSDWLFVMARLANQRAGVEDVPWKK